MIVTYVDVVLRPTICECDESSYERHKNPLCHVNYIIRHVVFAFIAILHCCLSVCRIHHAVLSVPCR